MKKIQLADGMPATIKRQNISKSTEQLLDMILNVCKDSGLNYVAINTALYVADEELYRKAIEQPLNK